MLFSMIGFPAPVHPSVAITSVEIKKETNERKTKKLQVYYLFDNWLCILLYPGIIVTVQSNTKKQRK